MPRTKGFPDTIHHIVSEREKPIPDIRTYGVDEFYLEFDVTETRFGQVVGYILVFASANWSSQIPNVYLVVERRKSFGHQGDGPEESTHWGWLDVAGFEEWVKHHELQSKPGHPIKIPINQGDQNARREHNRV